VAAAVVAMLALKTAVVAADAVPFNGDEAIVALMARHIQAGERPVFFYGQAYLGSTDAWLIAAAFSVFGQSVLSIRIVQALLFAGTLITTFPVARRVGLSNRASWLAVLLVALPPTMLTLYTTATLGGYGETLLFGNLLILSAVSLGGTGSAIRPQRSARRCASGARQARHHPLKGTGDTGFLRAFVPSWLRSHLPWALFGVVAGFAFWTFGLILVYLIPILVWLFYRHRLSAWRGYGAAALGFAIGSAPWWTTIGSLGGSLFGELSGSAVANTVAAPTLLDSLGVRLINFFVFGMPAWFGLRYPWSAEIVLPVLALAVSALYLSAFVFAIRRGSRILWGMIGALLLAYLLTPFGGDPSGRYFVPLYLPLSIFAATLIDGLRDKPSGPGKRWLPGLLAALILGYNVAGTWLALGQPHGITTQFDRVTWIERGRQRQLIDFLLSHDETRGYTNYWVAYPIAFLSGERVIGAPRLPYHLDLSYTRRDDRYPPYAQAVAESPRAFYITTHHPSLDTLIRDGLSDLGVTFSEETIGSYHIFYALSRKVEPEELRLNRITE
jgi:hypothetical protein